MASKMSKEEKIEAKKMAKLFRNLAKDSKSKIKIKSVREI